MEINILSNISVTKNTKSVKDIQENNKQTDDKSATSGEINQKTINKILLICVLAFLTAFCLLVCLLLNVNSSLDVIKTYFDVLSELYTFFGFFST